LTALPDLRFLTRFPAPQLRVGASAEQEPAEKAAAQAPRKTQQVLALPKAGVGGKGHLTKVRQGSEVK
jgi:hypothetical protein